MTTTIQIQDETAELLKRYKEQLHLKTYDEAIRKMMHLGDYAKQFRGILGKGTMKDVMKDLRDKTDRF